MNPNFPNFTGGFVASFGYESISLNEKIPVYPLEKGDFPEVVLMLFETIFVINEEKNSLRIFNNIQIDPGHTLKTKIENSETTFLKTYAKTALKRDACIVNPLTYYPEFNGFVR